MSEKLMQKLLSDGNTIPLSGKSANLIPKLCAIAFGVLVFGAGNFVLPGQAQAASANCVKMQDYSLLNVVREQALYMEPGMKPASISGKCQYLSTILWQMDNVDGSRLRVYYDAEIKADGYRYEDRHGSMRLVKEFEENGILRQVELNYLGDSIRDVDAMHFFILKTEFMESVISERGAGKDNYERMSQVQLENDLYFNEFKTKRGISLKQMLVTAVYRQGVTEYSTPSAEHVISPLSAINVNNIIKDNAYYNRIIDDYMTSLQEENAYKYRQARSLDFYQLRNSVGFREFEKTNGEAILNELGRNSSAEFRNTYLDVTRELFLARVQLEFPERVAEFETRTMESLQKDPDFKEFERNRRTEILDAIQQIELASAETLKR